MRESDGDESVWRGKKKVVEREEEKEKREKREEDRQAEREREREKESIPLLAV